MRSLIVSILFVALLAGMLVVGYRKYQQEVAVPQEVKATAAIPIVLPREAADARPQPPLANSDSDLREVLAGLFPGDPAATWVLDHFVERCVLLIDTLPRRALIVHRLPLQPPPGDFRVTGAGEEKTLGDENSRRYAPLVRLLTAVDTQRLVAVYDRYYPLFQEAYRNLGYPSEAFNDRLLTVIDHLLAAPEVEGPILLERLRARYRFTDPELETLSAGQKILLRMGSENARMLKDKLREMRRELVGGPQAGAE